MESKPARQKKTIDRYIPDEDSAPRSKKQKRSDHQGKKDQRSPLTLSLFSFPISQLLQSYHFANKMFTTAFPHGSCAEGIPEVGRMAAPCSQSPAKEGFALPTRNGVGSMAGPSRRSPAELRNGTAQDPGHPPPSPPPDSQDPTYSNANPRRCNCTTTAGGIMKPADAATNQCLVYAVLNVLSRDPAAYTAFTGGNSTEPARAFVEYMDTREVTGADGYDAASITWYLKYLRNNNRIVGFEWQRLNGAEYRVLFSTTFTDGALILLGISPATDEREKTKKKTAKVERQLKDSPRVEQEALTVAVAEGKRHRKSKVTHAIGLRVEGNTRVLYDTRYDVAKVCTAKELVCSVEKVHAIHRLRIFT